ncbi:MAG TPA: hypothetical protein VHM26_12730, partial [Chitinophagaceae bacterium]|nr:hypothetical protein [Chitinophagaceae bacterium]
RACPPIEKGGGYFDTVATDQCSSSRSRRAAKIRESFEFLVLCFEFRPPPEKTEEHYYYIAALINTTGYMSKFVIHKKGFFYTDDSWDCVDEVKGSIAGTFSTLEEARKMKEELDIISLQKMNGFNVADFIMHTKNYKSLLEQLETYFRQEWNKKLQDGHYLEIPVGITAAQASEVKRIIGVSFHDIVEYPDDTVINPADFIVDDELSEF